MSRLPAGLVTVAIDGFSHGGEGVARVHGKAVFVPGALPGEHVAIEIVDDRKRWARARLVQVEHPSPDRVVPPCPHAQACGGCDLQHVTPAGQLGLKRRVVVEQLQRLGGIDDPPVGDAVAVGPELGYRTVARMTADSEGRLGFHRRSSDEVVPIDNCPILTPATQAVRELVGDGTGASEVIVRATSAGHRGAALVAGPTPPDIDHLADTDLELQVTGSDGLATTRSGDGTVIEHVAGFEFEVALSGFFQGNTPGAEALVAAVLAEAGDVANVEVWDLYAGVGLFSLPLARAGARVTAVEVDATAVRHLVGNANAAGSGDRVTAHARDVTTFVESRHDHPPDVVVLDPPRTGAGTQVVTGLAALAGRRIIYVACDVAALGRDARALVAAGWRLAKARPFDLFPMTHHVEVVATFEPAR